MDLDTFLTTVYVIVDDWYKATVQETLRRRSGCKPQLSDSEVLTIALLGQWRCGVPWQSERGLVRYMQTHGRTWFPDMIGRSAFNQRVRNLWAVFVALQQAIARWLEVREVLYECVDCVPLPACSLAQTHRQKQHWWGWGSYGHGGTGGGMYFGDQVGMSVTPQGSITGWLVTDAWVDDRWVLQSLLRLRAGQDTLHSPGASASGKNRPSTPPLVCPQPRIAAGEALSHTYLADGGFGGARWNPIWTDCQAVVLAPPPPNAPHAWSKALKRWHSQHRQPIETVFATLTQTFSLKRVRAHSRWGQLACLAAMFAAHNLGLWLNKQMGRPLQALATLLC